MRNLSPLYINAITKQLEGISDRKLAFLLGMETNLNIVEIRKELANFTIPE